jgi:hypothetical protein
MEKERINTEEVNKENKDEWKQTKNVITKKGKR